MKVIVDNFTKKYMRFPIQCRCKGCDSLVEMEKNEIGINRVDKQNLILEITWTCPLCDSLNFTPKGHIYQCNKMKVVGKEEWS